MEACAGKMGVMALRNLHRPRLCLLVFGTLLGIIIILTNAEDLPLGTKRPYEKLEVVIQEGENILAHKVDAELTSTNICGGSEDSLQYVAVISRHGERYPTSKKKEKLEALAERICAADPLLSAPPQQGAAEERAGWCDRVRREVVPKRAGSLTEAGKASMRALGAWWAAHYHSSPRGARRGGGGGGGGGGGAGGGGGGGGGGGDTAGAALAAGRLGVARTSTFRTLQSCYQFFQGLEDEDFGTRKHEVSDIICSRVANDILKPYKTCANQRELRAAFKETLHITPSMKLWARERIAAKTGLDVDTVTESDILAAYYACQTDIAIEPDLSFGSSFGCDLLGPFNEQLSLMEHLENYELRGFGRPVGRELMAGLLRELTTRLEGALAAAAAAGKEGEEGGCAPPGEGEGEGGCAAGAAGAAAGPVYDLYFSHDSALLPLVALMDLLDLGTNPYTAQAARLCPFSARLVVEAYRCGAILVEYNEQVVRAFASPDAWRAAYAPQLAVDVPEVCGGHAPFLEEEGPAAAGAGGALAVE